MRYPAAEKLEIIRLVEQSHLPVRRTLAKIGIPPTTFYRWYDRFVDHGPEGLEDRPSCPSRVWNRIPAAVRDQIVTMALEEPDLSPRELAVKFTDTEKYFVSEDRIRLVSENAALDFLNYKDFKEATEDKSYKTWHTIIDGKERETHHKENQTTIPINNYSLVGNALMRYPHDMAVAFTNPEEVINCRCWVTYS